MQRLALGLPLLASLAAIPAHAATLASFQNGEIWCVMGTTCAFTAQPGTGDTAVVQHFVTLNGGGTPAPPNPLSVGPIDIVAGGTLGIYSGGRLHFDGGNWTGGALDACCNSGGIFANQGMLTISANPLAAFRGVLENNATLRVTPAGHLFWNQGNGGGTLANLTTGPDAAVVELAGAGRIGGVVTLSNEGIVRKTGAGTSVFDGTLRNRGTSAIRPGTIEVLEGTLAIADTPGYNGRLVSEGLHIDVADATVLAIRDGGDLLLVPEAGASQVYVTTGSGDGHVRLETGGVVRGTLRLPDNAAAAVMDFDAGVFEWTGGTFDNFTVRNVGEITIAGTDGKTIAGELENAGLIKLVAPVLTNASILRIVPGGVFEAQDDTAIVGVGNSRIHVEGTLRKVPGAGTFTIGAFSLEGTGRIEANGGHLYLTEGSLTHPASFHGTVALLANAALDVPPGHSVFLDSDTVLTGVGSVNAGQFEQRGLVEPGTPYGALVVSGYLLQNNFTPVTRINVGGTQPVTQYAQVQVTGDLRPQGVLRVNFRDGYAPIAGTTFDLITVGGNLVFGSVASYAVQIEGLAPGFQYSLTLSPQNTVRLTALSDGLSLADYLFADGFE